MYLATRIRDKSTISGRTIPSNQKMEVLPPLILGLEHQVVAEPRRSISLLGQEVLPRPLTLIQVRFLRCFSQEEVVATCLQMNTVNLRMRMISSQKCLVAVVLELPKEQVAFQICSPLCREEAREVV